MLTTHASVYRAHFSANNVRQVLHACNLPVTHTTSHNISILHVPETMILLVLIMAQS